MMKRNKLLLSLISVVLLVLAVQVVFAITWSICGDTETSSLEDCDDGADGDDGNQCYDDCSFTFCGDGIVQYPNGKGEDGNSDGLFFGYEDCDDGANGDDTDECYDNCTYTFCGDGIMQVPNGNGLYEECDDGAETDACSSSCEYTYCGDGTVQEGEECDDDSEECVDCECVDGTTPNDNGTCIPIQCNVAIEDYTIETGAYGSGLISASRFLEFTNSFDDSPDYIIYPPNEYDSVKVFFETLADLTTFKTSVLGTKWNAVTEFTASSVGITFVRDIGEGEFSFGVEAPIRDSFFALELGESVDEFYLTIKCK